MDEFMSEKEQVEALRKWWKENGGYIIAGLVLGLAILGGWRYWEQYRDERAARASDTYQALVEAVEGSDREAAESLATTLRDDYAATPYAVQGELMMARLHVEAGALDQARTLLDRTLADVRDPELAPLVRLRLARVEHAAGEPAAALATLEAGEPGAYRVLYEELAGDALRAQGQLDRAAARYQAALDALEEDRSLGNRQVIEMKLNDTRVLRAETSGAAEEEESP